MSRPSDDRSHSHGTFDASSSQSLSRPIDRFDPRVRILLVLHWSLAIAVVDRPAVLAWACVGSVTAAAILIRTDLLLAARRLTPLWLTIGLLYLLLPFHLLVSSSDQTALLARIAYGGEGLRIANLAALKGAAIAIALAALIGTLSPGDAAGGLGRLGVPRRLVELMMLTIRQLHCLRDEYIRTRRAMRIRGFRPRMNRHTYRSLGYVIGMVFVRSHLRGVRIIEAMKCRAYTGRLPTLHRRTFSPRLDIPLGLIGAAAVIAVLWFGLLQPS